MKLDVLLSRARYLAIVLPSFALFTTVHGGCTSGTFYYYGKGAGYRTASGNDAPGGPEACVVYRTGESGGDQGYFGPCDDEGYAYGGSGGSAP